MGVVGGVVGLTVVVPRLAVKDELTASAITTPAIATAAIITPTRSSVESFLLLWVFG